MDFYKRLGIVCRAVPEGKVITYGQAALVRLSKKCQTGGLWVKKRAGRRCASL